MKGQTTREIGRAAIRDQLARVAMPLFHEIGFDRTTFDDLASAAGVSRSTFLRYFGNKEDVVLFLFDPLGDAMSQALATRPAAENEWTALRRAVDPAVDMLTRDPADGLALLRLVWNTPSLWGRLHDKQSAWRPALVQGLAERSGSDAPAPIVLRTRVMAALGCLMVAFDGWVDCDGTEELSILTDLTFGALAPNGRSA